jgi:NAD(P)-dependent dehydrogenase (short-subunit alcohol dehydrogenase family)
MSVSSFSDLFSLAGRTVLITGGTGHIARAMAQTFCQMGGSVILVDRDLAALDSFAAQLRAEHSSQVTVILCDLEDEAQRSAMLAQVQTQIPRLDVLVNNAAFVGSATLQGWAVPFAQQSLETWRRAIEVNLTAIFHLSQALTPMLGQNGVGSIINIGSIYGEYGPDWGLYEGTAMANPAAYAASKGGVFQLTRWLATTIAPHVRVNAISPGGVARGQPESFVQKYTARTPLRRMAEEKDFCGAAAFLASDASAYVTGQVLRIDGGWGVW